MITKEKLIRKTQGAYELLTQWKQNFYVTLKLNRSQQTIKAKLSSFVSIFIVSSGQTQKQ